MNIKIDKVILHLSLIEGIGPSTIQSLIEKKPQNIAYENMYKLSTSEWRSLFGVSDRVAQKLYSGLKDRTLFEQELQLIEENSVSWLSREHEQYPSLLKEINCPPPILYWYGEKPISEKTITIIGARKANEYARRAINRFVTDFVAQDYTIVSGGAIGADSMAHTQTVKLGGKTIAVLGSGLLHPYPATNRMLFNNIIKTGGTVLSIFPMDTLPQTGNFPTRNRVIAGLSRGCIVAQAAEKSGARITAQFALEQGRDVFAVPGSIEDPLSFGCHALIKEGATIISSVQDVFCEWSVYADAATTDKNITQIDDVKKQTTITQTISEKEVVKQEVIKKDVTSENNLSDEQKSLLQLCIRPTSFDDILKETGLSSEVVSTQLFDLQLSGKLKQDFTGMWVSV